MVSLGNVSAHVVRSNMRMRNGMLHIVDAVLFDDADTEETTHVYAADDYYNETSTFDNDDDVMTSTVPNDVGVSDGQASSASTVIGQRTTVLIIVLAFIMKGLFSASLLD